MLSALHTDIKKSHLLMLNPYPWSWASSSCQEEAGQPVSLFFFSFQEIISDLILAMKYLHETIHLNACEVSNQEDC